MARWRLYLGRSLIEEYHFDKNVIRIGRQADADIVLDHQSVSRRRALLERDAGIWRVKIEDGKNGLFVNGQFATERVLQNGDRIEIGRHVILFIQTPNAISLEEETLIGLFGDEYSLYQQNVPQYSLNYLLLWFQLQFFLDCSHSLSYRLKLLSLYEIPSLLHRLSLESLYSSFLL